ncbi:MAG: DUF3052 domain-containing protein [Bifidobacteriaceae bacterium]|nr:DUF3052 domain-containing protein [Bifidobacteriaceae bacterium]
MSATDSSGTAGRLGFTSGQLVQELGYDKDVDASLRAGIEAATGGDLVDEDWGDTVDAAIIWWRDSDGDLTDTLVDVLAVLEDGGVIWVLTPKARRPGYVEPGDISEAANTAGLHATSTTTVAPDWAGTRLAMRVRGARRG